MLLSLLLGVTYQRLEKLLNFLAIVLTKDVQSEISNGSGNNYSGFDRSLWTPQRNEQHQENVAELQAIHIKQEKQKASEFGCRYFTFIKAHFDLIKMLLIDPMHNLSRNC